MGLFKIVNKQVRRTRDWIFNALLSLLDEKKYEDIKIANITEKAGVARQSFYRNYEGKDDIISKFIENLFSDFNERLDAMEKEAKKSGKDPDYSGIYLLFFEIMFEYRSDLLKLKNASLSHLIYNNFWICSNKMIEAFFRESKLDEEKLFFVKYQLGGIIAAAVEWVYNDMLTTPAEQAKILSACTFPFADDPFCLPKLIENVRRKNRKT